jgi:protein-arginine kinase activator protein McsA
MGKTIKRTTELFVVDASRVHNNYYTYEFTKYINSKTKLTVTCREHGNFEITAQKHIEGQGCVHCKRRAFGLKSRHSMSDFLTIAEAKHGDKYDYSKVVLKTDSDMVEIICRKHGSFWQKPATHKQGQGCQVCARDATADARRLDNFKFLVSAVRKHGSKYDYTKVVVVDAQTKVEIVCPHHGPFWLTPSKHTSGRGCPKCSWEGSGYSQTKPGTFYILKHEDITKVGITNRMVLERLKGINRGSGLDFKLHSSVYSEDGAKARNIELQVLSWLKLHYKNVETKFDGYTECFLDVDIDALMNFVVPIS